MIRSLKTSPPAACGPTHHCMVHVYTLWLLIPVSFHTRTGNGNHIPHTDWEPHSIHRLGKGPSFHAQTASFHMQTGNGTFFPYTDWEKDPHSMGMGPSLHTQTRKTDPTHSHIISKVHTVEVHNAARDVDGDKQSWSQFSCIVKPKF